LNPISNLFGNWYYEDQLTLRIFRLG